MGQKNKAEKAARLAEAGLRKVWEKLTRKKRRQLERKEIHDEATDAR